MLSAAGLLGYGTRAARRQWWLVVPVMLARWLGQMLGLVPGGMLVVGMLRAGQQQGASDPATAYLLGLVDLLKNPAPLLITAEGALLALVGGWLLMTIVEGGALCLLAAQAVTTTTAEDRLFADGVLVSYDRALLTGLAVAVLRLVTLVSGFGMVGLAMVAFANDPGPLAALMLTVGAAAIVCIPILLLGLDIGFARAILRREPSLTALANGLDLAWRRLGATLPLWYLFVIVEVGVSVGFATADAGLSPLAITDVAILAWGPRVFIWTCALFAMALVHLARLGTWATLIAEDADALPTPPEPHVPEEPLDSAVPVAQVVQVAQPAVEEPPPDDSNGPAAN